MKIHLPKKYYLKQIQKGKLTKNEVAKIFSTSYANVEKAYDNFIKPRNPFELKGESEKHFYIQNIITIVVSILSTIMVLSTLLEMQAARNAAYIPCVSFNNTEIAIVWDSEGQTKNINEKLVEEAKQCFTNSETRINVNPIFKLFNIGVGTAKEVLITWNTKQNIKEFNRIFSLIGKEAVYDERFDMIKIFNSTEDKENDENWRGTGAGSYNYFDFILTSDKDNCSLMLPQIYYDFIFEIISSDLYWEHRMLPKISIVLKCLDIQNKSYEKKLTLYFRMRAGKRTKNNDGYFVFDMYARED